MEKVILKYFPFLSWKNVIITSSKKMIKGDVLIDDGIHNLLDGDYKKILMTAVRDQRFQPRKIIEINHWEIM